ncbi:hypothetical protein LB520_26780 [Mesorhizobium sp. CA12]|nr:hypothetical protein [Mesorhizobium sp. CA12]
MVVVEHGRRLLQRLVSSLCVLPGSRHFENHKFDRHPVSSAGLVPSKTNRRQGVLFLRRSGAAVVTAAPPGEGVWLQPLGADTAPGKNGRKTTLIV